MAEVLHVRVDSQIKNWLEGIAADTGLSVSRVTGILLSDARSKDVKVERSPGPMWFVVSS